MKTIYYTDELNDEFSKTQLKSKVIDDKFKYKKNIIWNAFSWLIQNILSMPIKLIHMGFVLHHKFIGKEKIKEVKGKGYFVYGNHTMAFADTFIPSVMVYPKRNFLIVNGENVSIKGFGWLVELLGAIPIPSFMRGSNVASHDGSSNIKAAKNFLDIIKYRIGRGSCITIYPEAHIWPYCTWIRNFKAVSFKYPVELDVPCFAFTNTYVKRGKNKFRIVTYVDGPFYPDRNISSKKDRQMKLRDEVYNAMCRRAENSNFEKIKYVKKDAQKVD